MVVYIYFVEWKPFCVTFGELEKRYMAVITPYQMTKVVPGRKVPGFGGITKGFVDKVWNVTVDEEVLNKVNQHLNDINLFITVKDNKYHLITDSGNVLTFKVNEKLNIPSADYPLEVHKMI